MENSGIDFFQVPETTVAKEKGKCKARLVPEYYVLPRHSIPNTIAWCRFLSVAAIGAGMLVEAWIKKRVQNDTAILWRKDDETGRNSNPSPSSKP